MFAVVVAFAIALLFASPARAQLDAGMQASCKGSNVVLGADVTRSVSNRPSLQSPLWVSYADCNSADEFTFPVNVLNANIPSIGETLEVWVGEGIDCRAAGSRSPLVVGETIGSQCVQVASMPLGAVVVNHKPVIIPAAKIANAVVGVTTCNDTNTATLAHIVTLYFMIIRENVATIDAVGNNDASCWNQTNVDLLGPNPPPSVTAGVGDSTIIVSYDISTEEADTQGYYFYCDDGSGAATDAGVQDAVADASDAANASDAADASDADASDADVADAEYPGAASCPPSQVLIPGAIPSASLPTCGSAGKGATGSTGPLPLENHVEYTIGVAAYDVIGNAGHLSDLACATPQPIDDFYKIYRQAGGKAGGGYCSVDEPGTGGTLLGAGALGIVLGLFVRRRTRRAASRRGKQ